MMSPLIVRWDPGFEKNFKLVAEKAVAPELGVGQRDTEASLPCYASYLNGEVSKAQECGSPT